MSKMDAANRWIEFAKRDPEAVKKAYESLPPDSCPQCAQHVKERNDLRAQLTQVSTERDALQGKLSGAELVATSAVEQQEIALAKLDTLAAYAVKLKEALEANRYDQQHSEDCRWKQHGNCNRDIIDRETKAHTLLERALSEPNPGVATLENFVKAAEELMIHERTRNQPRSERERSGWEVQFSQLFGAALAAFAAHEKG